MGSCLCTRKLSGRTTNVHSSVSTLSQHLPDRITSGDNGSGPNNVVKDIKESIKQTLVLIRFFASKEQILSASLQKLNTVAGSECGWLLVVKCLIETVPMSDSLGPAVISLFLDECPIPSPESVSGLIHNYVMPESEKNTQSAWHHNTAVVLGCLSENLSGPGSARICTNSVLSYLISNLDAKTNPHVILHTLITLEKIARKGEHRTNISSLLESHSSHPILKLELWLNHPRYKFDWIRQQIGFCAQWLLDNVLPHPDRTPSYLSVATAGINAVLNQDDVSEYLKISANGIVARCDTSSFESVRCTFEAFEDVWFYEVLLYTAGVMQIGFATKESRFCNHEGYGIGDDEYSLAYDGCRQLIWHDAQSEKNYHRRWSAGDYLGCLINFSDECVQFYLNGQGLDTSHCEFMKRRGNDSISGVFAAASFMSFQQCQFNFGSEPFRYPPKGIVYKTFNDYGHLTDEQKTILPRRVKMELISNAVISDESCNICYSNSMDTILEPCGHGSICFQCSCQIEQCHLCRMKISKRVRVRKRQSLASQKQ